MIIAEGCTDHQSRQAQAEASQRQILARLEAHRAQGKVGLVIPYWVFNGLSVNATAEVIQDLAARADVRSITPDEIQVVREAVLAANAPETNLALINAPALWTLGYQGQGFVVANMDSGVDVNHPDLNTRWRGGSSSSQRNWLREFQVYAGGSAPPTPTSTATAAPTATATPTALPSPAAAPGTSTYVHVGDLDGSTSTGNRGRWNAVVTISVHNSSEAPVAGASVSGSWSGGASGGASCQTGVSGTCTVSLTNLKSNAGSVTFTVSSISTSGGSYQPSANHDPDGDSNGTDITVLAP